MRRAAGALLLACTLSAGQVQAHGLPPRALSPLSAAGSSLQLVQLTRGLALRTGRDFHYFCPSLWDGNENAPAAYIPNGPAVLALATGLITIAPDGASAPYPESELGTIIALAASETALYALALHGEQYELRSIGATRSQLLWSADQSAGDWLTLSAGASALQLLGLTNGTLTQLELDSAGAPRQTQHAVVPVGTLSAQAQIAGTTLYVILQFESGDHIELGRVVGDSWVRVCQATSTLAGPIDTEDGQRLIGVDGELATFEGEQLAVIDDAAEVTGLWRFAGASYASVKAGLRVLGASQPRESVFEIGLLLPPTTESSVCAASWGHLQVDLVAAGLIDVSQPDAGPPVVAPDAAVPTNAGVAVSPPQRASRGCAIGAGTHADCAWLVVFWTAVARMVRRRSKRARSQ